MSGEENMKDEIVCFDDAVLGGADSEDYDEARKLASLAVMLEDDSVTAESAAASSDQALFEKAASARVAAGECSAETATESLIDRGAAAVVAVSRPWISRVLETAGACVGTAIGSALGSPVVGRCLGTAVGHWLSEAVGDKVATGVARMADYAKKAWPSVVQVAKQTAGKLFQRATNCLLS